MPFKFDKQNLDVETAVELLNRLAREHPEGEGLTYNPEDEGLAKEDFEYYEPLTHPMDMVLGERTNELFEETTFLSENEAFVVASKELGLTHGAIALWWGLTAGTGRKSTVDEYSRRARQKYLKAKRTVDELEALYGGDAQ